MGALPWVVYFEVQIALIFCRVWSEQSASCFVQAKSLCRYGCMYFLTALVLVCVDVMVMSSSYSMTCTGALGGGMSAV